MKGMIQAEKTYHFMLSETEMQGLTDDIQALVRATMNLPAPYNLSDTSNMIIEMSESLRFNEELFN